MNIEAHCDIKVSTETREVVSDALMDYAESGIVYGYTIGSIMFYYSISDTVSVYCESYFDKMYPSTKKTRGYQEAYDNFKKTCYGDPIPVRCIEISFRFADNIKNSISKIKNRLEVGNIKIAHIAKIMDHLYIYYLNN